MDFRHLVEVEDYCFKALVGMIVGQGLLVTGYGGRGGGQMERYLLCSARSLLPED